MMHFDPILWLAQASQGTQANPTAQTLQMLGTFAVLGVIFYFLMIRPQQTKAREHAAILKTLKPGDRILTSGGLLGIVISVKEKSVSIRSADSKLEVLKSAISEIVEKSASASEPEVK
jgi:preprotein translocase subunit YajC